MLNKKTVAMAMAVATIAPTVAPIVANAAENVTEIQVSSGETEKIAKINAELEKAKSIFFTNDRKTTNSQGEYTEVYAKYEKNDMGTNVNVPVYKIERTVEGSQEIIKVIDKGHREGYETTWNPETNTNKITKVTYDHDEAGNDIKEKLVAKITITTKSTVNEYEIDAKELFKTNGKYNELGQRLVNYIKANMTNFTQETVVKGNTTGKKLTVIGKDGKLCVITVWGNPVVNTEDSTIGALAGLDRCETAVQVSQEGWTKSDTVIVAGWDGLADGLAVTPLAAAIDAPILISTRTGLDTNTKAEIDRLNAKNVIIVGGEKTVTPEVEKQLKSMGLNVERISGQDRMRTSFEIAKRLEKELAAKGKKISEVYVAGGYNGEADALSISSNAGKLEQPILLVEKNRIADDVKSWIYDYTNKYNENGVKPDKEITVIGGSYAISSNVADDLKELDKDKKVEQIGGANVQETNAQVINKYHANSKGLFIAQDKNLVDALAAGPLAAKKNVPVVLGTNNISDSQAQAISKNVEVEKDNSYQIGHGVARSVVRYIQALLTK